jgi:hypothetical protein
VNIPAGDASTHNLTGAIRPASAQASRRSLIDPLRIALRALIDGSQSAISCATPAQIVARRTSFESDRHLQW